MKATALRTAAPALLLAAAALLPFLDKAFTMDDTVFLWEARHAVSDPLHPTAFEIHWGHLPERVSAIVPTGPVMAWLLVPAVLAGGDERVAHALQLALLWVAIVATVSLALRLGLERSGAAAAGLLLAATPAVLGMAGTAMPDVPALALGVAGIERIAAWREDRRWHQGVAAALLLGFAALARTHLVLLLPVAALFAAGDFLSPGALRRLAPSAWLPVAGAACVTASVLYLTRDPSPGGGSLASAAAGLSSLERVPSNLVAFFVHWVLAMAFALPLAVLHRQTVFRRPWVLLAATLLAALLLRRAHGDAAPWMIAPVAGLGAAVLVDVLARAVRARDALGLTLGLWLLVALPTVIYTHLPAKVLLASAPAAAILVARSLAGQPRLGRAVLVGTLLLGAGLGVAILQADAAFAGLGRTGAQTLIRPRVAAGQRVWYVGHWGFQWYAEEAGARFFPVRPPFPAVGDLVVSSARSEPHLALEEMKAVVHLGRLEDRRAGGRAMDRDSGAGFFSNHWGYLPWAWGGGLREAVDVWRVVPEP